MQAKIVNLESSVMHGEPIVPTLTITHIRGKSGTNFTEPEIETLTVFGVMGSPNDLARAFLEFVCLNEGVSYTHEEHANLSHLIVTINQRIVKK
jgi:hypothetical protein